METQDTAENPTTRLLTAEQRLLAEGVPAYLDAMVAIQEFRQTVQKRCRQVLRAELADFSRSIGIPLDVTKIEDYADPDGVSDVATTDWGAWIGVRIRLQNAGKNVGIAYAALGWSKEHAIADQPPVIEVWVAFELTDRALFARVWESIKQAEPQVESSYDGIIQWYKPVPLDNIPSFVDILTDLLGEWSRLWQRVGIRLGVA